MQTIIRKVFISLSAQVLKKCKSNQKRRESNRGGIDQNPDYGLQLFLEKMRKYFFLAQKTGTDVYGGDNSAMVDKNVGYYGMDIGEAKVVDKNVDYYGT